jgi:hypothetical protein
MYSASDLIPQCKKYDDRYPMNSQVISSANLGQHDVLGYMELLEYRFVPKKV